MAKVYSDSPEIEQVAKTIIPTLGWLEQPKIKYLMLDADKSDCMGKCSRATGKWKHLTGYDYIIEAWRTGWDSCDEHGKEALVYHELLHVTSKVDKNGEVKWGIKKHDLEEFFDVARKYGAWDLAIKTFIECFTKE
jgi:Putative phage metallopeptidase